MLQESPKGKGKAKDKGKGKGKGKPLGKSSERPSKGKGKGKRKSKSRPSAKPCDADWEESEEEVWDEGQEEEYEEHQEPEDEEEYPEEAAECEEPQLEHAAVYTAGTWTPNLITPPRLQVSRVETTQTGRAVTSPGQKSRETVGARPSVGESRACVSATDIAPVDHEEGIYWSRQPPIEWMLLDSRATHQVTYLPTFPHSEGSEASEGEPCSGKQSV